MLLGILSDTHDEVARTCLAVQLLRAAGAAALIHCGDLTGPPIVAALAGLPAWFVFGNHDAVLPLAASPSLVPGGAKPQAAKREMVLNLILSTAPHK